jgi:class 3 adenylate cyclase
MGNTMFLQEVEATVMVSDVRDFEPLAKQLGPVDLGLALSRFYEHIGGIVESHHGRIVKFIGDGVLSVFLGSSDHKGRALSAIFEAIKTRQAFLDENARNKLPLLDYHIGAASGTVLAGEIGTEKLRFFDVLGQPVNHAFRLTSLATRRGVTNLVESNTYEGVADKAKRPAAVETDVVELDAEKLRLFKIEA